MGYESDIRTALSDINTDYQLMVSKLFGENLPGNYLRYTDVMPTTSLIKKLTWIGALPLMRKWVGSRVSKSFRTFYTSIELEKYEATLPIERMEIQYDRSGAVTKALGQWLSTQAQVYDLGASAMLLSNPTGFDGVALFSASHPFAQDGGLNSNYSTNALTRANYETARVVMQSYTDEAGRKVYNQPDTIICGPALESKAKEIFEAKTRKVVVDSTGDEATQFNIAATNMDNVWAGELDVIIDPNFIGTYAYYWILLNTKLPGVKPVVILEGRKIESINLDKMDDETRFRDDKFIFGLESDFSFAAGFWPVCYGNLATSL